MKNLLKISFLLLAITLILPSCKKKASGDKANTTEASGKTATAPATAANFSVNTGTSQITWTGSKPTGSSHMGTVKLSQGKLSVVGNEIKSGSFSIDLNTISNTDQTGKQKQDLERHLKNADFFDVGAFSSATFVISNVSALSGVANATHKITGDLTIKGIKKSISFNAHVGVVGKKLMAVTPAFSINRTDWGINFHSGIVNTIKDKLINDDVKMVISLNAEMK